MLEINDTFQALSLYKVMCYFSSLKVGGTVKIGSYIFMLKFNAVV